MKYLQIILIALFIVVGTGGYFLGRLHKDKTSVVYVPSHDYQIECVQDSITIYDGSRIVGSLPYDSSRFSNIILDDNQ